MRFRLGVVLVGVLVFRKGLLRVVVRRLGVLIWAWWWRKWRLVVWGVSWHLAGVDSLVLVLWAWVASRVLRCRSGIVARLGDGIGEL